MTCIFDLSIKDCTTSFFLAVRELEVYLSKTLELNWKPKATILASVKEGVPFLGFRIFKTHTRIKASNWRRFKKHFLAREKQFMQGQIDDVLFEQSIESMIAFVCLADSKRLREEFFAKHPLDW